MTKTLTEIYEENIDNPPVLDDDDLLYIVDINNEDSEGTAVSNALKLGQLTNYIASKIGSGLTKEQAKKIALIYG